MERRPTEPASTLPGDAIRGPAGRLADRVVRETGPPPMLGKVGPVATRAAWASFPDEVMKLIPSPLGLIPFPLSPALSPVPGEREKSAGLIPSGTNSGAISTSRLPVLAARATTVAPPDTTRLVDSFGRRLTYLRVSVTDRCNLRCTYCLPADAEFPFGDRAFLSPVEMETLVGALVRLGIRRVRLTGGEPLIRKDILEIVERLKALPGLENLALSTNGTELARLAPALKTAGLDRVNISVDSLDPERFEALTRRGLFQDVWRGVEAALDAGLHPVKLNSVLLADGADDFERLAALTLDRPLTVRFIELMATASNQHLEGQFLSADDVKLRLEARFGPLEEHDDGEPRTGPARSYRFRGAVGSIGFITPMSHTFCADCNRLRLTSRGDLRLCLFADKYHPLRPLLAESDPARRDANLETEILRVLQDKPEAHGLARGDYGNLVSFMQFGG